MADEELRDKIRAEIQASGPDDLLAHQRRDALLVLKEHVDLLDVAEAITSAFGSFADFKAKVKETGVGQFGSGWAWLVHDGSQLAVVGSPNQDNPVSNGLTPLLGVDVWEHAYYLKYKQARPDYLEAWFNTIDWDKVAERYSAVA